jgi:YtcA family
MRTNSARRGALTLLPALGLEGCSRSPSFNILGSFFPAWLLCVVVGILITFGIHVLLARWRIEPEMKPLVLVYPSIAATLAFGLWLLFFS